MITAPEVPRSADGNGIALCHYCQREIHFAGGFLKLLVKNLEWSARYWRHRRRPLTSTIRTEP